VQLAKIHLKLSFLSLSPLQQDGRECKAISNGDCKLLVSSDTLPFFLSQAIALPRLLKRLPLLLPHLLRLRQIQLRSSRSEASRRSRRRFLRGLWRSKDHDGG